MKNRQGTAHSGFTLIEMMIALSIITLILGVVGTVQLRSQSSYKVTSAQSRAQSVCRAAATRALDELAGAAISRFVPDPTTALGTDDLAFQRPEGVNDFGALQWSNQSRLSLAMDTNEVDNGVDDDGDRLVDERRLVLTRDADTPDPQVVTIAHSVPEWFPGESGNAIDDNGNGIVDERGFSVRRVGDLLFVRLSIAVAHSDGQIAQYTVETAAKLHN